MSTDLLLQMQNAAIDLARQLGAAERDVENLKRENADLRARPMMVVPREMTLLEPGQTAVQKTLKPLKERLEQWRMEQTAISVMSYSNTREMFIKQQLPPDHKYRTPALKDVEHAIAREITLIEKLRVAEEALRKLSCIGNGDRPGNSEGNVIAQEALARIKTIDFSVKS